MLTQYRSSWLHLEPTGSTAVHELQVPGPDDLLTSARNLIHSHRDVREKRGVEDNFSKTNLATNGAFFFRKAVAPLRSFLWRVLELGHVLEVRSVDLTRPQNDADEAGMILRFHFSSPIIPSLVAFADHPHEAELKSIYVFAITKNKHFYTLQIDPENLRKTQISQDTASAWCHFDEPSTLTVNEPHKLSAPSPFEVFIAYSNGVLARLRRPRDWNRLRWTQDVFDNRSWMSSFWDRDAAFKYEGKIYSAHAPSAIEPSSDQQFVFTVCLDHTLKVWNQATGKVISETSLMTGKQQIQSPEKPPMNPSSSSFIRSFYLGNGQHAIATYAPNDDSQFKFWDVSGGLTTPIAIKDRFPQVTLRPPDPDPSGNSVWSVTGLEINQDQSQRPCEIWVLWRSNNFHKLYSVKFDFSDLEATWQNSWVQASFKTLSDDAPPDPTPLYLVDTNERWYRFLLRPGRFTRDVLEVSLSLYQEALNLKTLKQRKDASLQERLYASVTSNVTLRKYDDSNSDYDRYSTDLDAQWRQIWRIARNVQARMRAPLSLSFDKLVGMPWIAMAGHGCVIRECSKIEMAWLNDSEPMRNPPAIGQARSRSRRSGSSTENLIEKSHGLIRAASILRQKSPSELLSSIETALIAQIHQEPENSAPARLTDFYESSNMNLDLPDETYEATLEALEALGGPSSVDNELFMAILELLPQDLAGQRSSLRYTHLGLKLIATGASDVICLCRQLLFDMCYLIVFLEYELDLEEMRSVDLNATDLFIQYTEVLREYEKRVWLATHTRKKRLLTQSVAGRSYPTVLEDISAVDIHPQPAVHFPQSLLITHSINDLVIWSTGASDAQPEDAAAYILCNLIANNDLKLANDFLRFQSHVPWAVYARGRVCLARRDFDGAAHYFRKSAYYLAHGKPSLPVDIASAGLLSPSQNDNFFNGLARYYQHIVALFEEAKADSQVTDFAHIGLQSLSAPQTNSDSLKLDLLSRLLTAELRCNNFARAYAAISRFIDKALQKSSMSRLVQLVISTIGATPGGKQALSILEALPTGIDSSLAYIVDDKLSELAKKQTVVPITRDGRYLQPHATDHITLLYAHRIRQNNFRGAVSVLLDRLNMIKRTGRARNDPQATELRRSYLFLINTLASVAPEDAYVLSEVLVGGMNGTEGKRRKIVVTLDDLRREYQTLLDKCSRIERGDYEFFADEEESEESEIEGEEPVSQSTVRGAEDALMEGAIDVS